MISVKTLKAIAKKHLKDAAILLQHKRFEGSIYLCGYGMELALKVRICKVLGWSGFPETRKEFDQYKSFKTHDLEVLLHLSGRESKIKGTHLSDWSIILKWDPEMRYKPKLYKKADAEDMFRSTNAVIKNL